MKKFYCGVLVLLVMCSFSGCRGTGTSPAKDMQGDKTSGIMYNKFNIHVHYKTAGDIKAHCANWTGPFSGHRVIPTGTPMVVKPWSKGFILERTDNGEKIHFIFSSKIMAMERDAYIDTILSGQKVSLGQFSAVDQQGIKDGTAIKGMTKKGIMTALGYPAAHRTPSLDAYEWIYWTNRFKTYAVIFDKNGRMIDRRN
ncbi:MAG: hypothetical protein HQK66_10620 [Desulfamplus sp.]|nr:hypothetical protein [Desulfamplus sp.]